MTSGHDQRASKQQTDDLASRAEILGRVADEFYTLMDRGERPDVDYYARLYPEVADAIRRVLPALSLLDERNCDDLDVNDPQARSNLSERRLGDFRIGREIGRGGMGVVYEAEQISMGRKVALKILPFAAVMDEKAITRFKNEARAAGTLHHDNIVPVHAVGNERGVYYYAMALIHGRTVAELIGELKLRVSKHTREAKSLTVHQLVSVESSLMGASRNGDTVSPTDEQETDRLVQNTLSTHRSVFDDRFYRQVVRLGIEAADALHLAHEHGIVHRDIKPGNLMIDGTGKVWIMDFGLARIESDAGITMTGDLLGTLRYMAPEQALGERLVVDHRADIYSLGVTLYELLTLRQAYNATNREALLKQLTFDEPKPIRHFHPDVPADLETIVLKAIARNPDERYMTSQQLAEDLGRFLEGRPVHAKPPSLTSRFLKWSRRHVAILWTVVVMSVLAGGLLGISTLAVISARRQEREANEQARANERIALDQRDTALLNQYHAEIVSGQTDAEGNHIARLRGKLMRHLPLARGPDRRGWEWYYLLSLCQPEERTLFYPHLSPFASWSPDGEYVAAAGSIWRADSGANIRRFEPSRIRNSAGAWSPNGRKYAWGKTADDRAIYVWDRETDSVDQLRGSTKGNIWSVAWSPDGKQLASGCTDDVVTIWDPAAKSVTKALFAGSNVTDLSWSPDGQLLAAGVQGGLKVWTTATDMLVADLELPPSRTYLSWHPNGERLAICGPKDWRLLDRTDWSVEQERHHSMGRGRSISWSPNGEWLAISDGDVVTIWEPTGDEPVRSLRGHSNPVVSVAWSPDAQQLVTSDIRQEIKIWNVSSVRPPQLLSTGTVARSLSWLEDNETVTIIDESDGSPSFWNLTEARQMRGDPAIARGELLWSPDHRLAAQRQGSNDGAMIRILYTETGKTHSRWHGNTEETLHSYSWSADGSRLAIATTAGNETRLTLWDVNAEQALSRWAKRGRIARPRKPFWSQRGNWIAVADSGEEGDNGSVAWLDHIYVIDAASGKQRLKHKPGGFHRQSGNVSDIAFSPDGLRVASGDTEGLLEVIEVGQGKTVFSTQHAGGTNELAWSPDGLRLVVCAQDGSVRILSANSGMDLLSFTMDGNATNVAWSPNGKRLAAVTESGKIRVWDASTGYEFSATGRRRGELAWAYLRASIRNPRVQRAGLIKALELAPDTLGFWRMRGDVQAKLGNFERATEEYSKVMAKGIGLSFLTAQAHAYALLGAGQRGEYHRFCESLVKEFASTEVLSNWKHVAWLYALDPANDIDSRTVLTMVQKAESDPDYKGEDQIMLVLGATLYRDQQFDDAGRLLTELVAKLETSGAPASGRTLACSQYFLAMTRHRSGHFAQARTLLDRAAKRMEAILPNSSWTQRIELETLDREARKQIKL